MHATRIRTATLCARMHSVHAHISDLLCPLSEGALHVVCEYFLSILYCLYTYGGVIGSGRIQVETLPVLTVVEGEDAVLECNATSGEEGLIPACSRLSINKWTVNGQLIASCSTTNALYSTRHMQFDNQTGSLIIHNVKVSDEATYECFVFTAIVFIRNTTQLRVLKGECIML